MEVDIADIVSTAAVVTVTPIWTKRWVSRLESFISYKMPSNLYTGSVKYEVEGTIDGIAYKDVLCSDCLCQMYACMKKLFNSYMNEIGRNDGLARQYESILVRLEALYMLYSVAQSCGNETELRSICGQIEAIINTVGCTC